MLGPALAVLLGAIVALAGCATERYFEEAVTKPATPLTYELGRLPFSEHWSDIAFNDARVGFSHLQIRPGENEDEYVLESEAIMRFRLLGVERTSVIRATDWVGPDLSLRRFDYDYDIDGSALRVSGRVGLGEVEMEVTGRGDPSMEVLPLSRTLYPSSAMSMYPVLRGLQIGDEFSFLMLDGQARKLKIVIQRVVAYEQSELFKGNAYRVTSQVSGQEVNTWIDAQGRPVLEMSMGGLFVAALRPAEEARRELLERALNQERSLLPFTRVPSNVSLSAPDEVETMTVALTGADERFGADSGDHQRCRIWQGRLVCAVKSARPVGGGTEQAAPPWITSYLAPSDTVASDDPRVEALSREFAGRDSQLEQVRSLMAWIGDNVERSALAVASAAEVLEGKRAGSTGLAYVYAAVARRLGIPTRIVHGLAYSVAGNGFVFQSWAESWVGGRWLPVDPSRRQVPADATHVKLLEGEDRSDLLPLIGMIGRLKAEISSIDGRPVL